MSEKKKYDIAIIGSGPGGYVAAIKAAQMNKSVALIDKGLLGGCCLNVGCIPTKTLLSNTAILQKIRHAKSFGISTGPISFNYAKMKERKDLTVSKIRTSLEGLLKANKITIYHGEAQFKTKHELRIKGEDSFSLEANKIIIATGSAPLSIRAFPFDHERILSSTSILEITQLPKSLAIVGGGYIGCEFASLFSELDVKITIFEAENSILSLQGTQIAQFMTKSLQSKGIEIKTRALVKNIENKKSHVTVDLEGGAPADFDLALVAVGRKVYTEGLELDRIGLGVNSRGAIETNDKMETAVSGIYAIGDVTGQWMLAHVASHQALVAASNAAGVPMQMHYEAVPAVIFTSPEIATVGLTLDQAKEKGFDAIAGMYPFQANSKAQASLDTEGFTQIVFDQRTGQILGAQVVGHEASNLIAEMVLAIQNELTLECLIDTIHAHPTLAESWLEAALIAKGTPINFPPRPKGP